MNEKIYPSMVIRSQAEAIELLQQENHQLKAELELYKGSLKKEHEQVHRANDLEDRIDKAIEFMQKNGEKQYNQHDNYRGKWYSPDELQTIDKILKGEKNE